MNSFAPPSKSNVNRANGTVQRVGQPIRTVVNNRPSAIAQRKLQQGINQQIQRKANGPALVIQREFKPVKGQEGEFEGDPAYHHIHRVSEEEHYKYGNGKRINFKRGSKVTYSSLENAIQECEREYKDRNDTGREACLLYMRELLANTEKPAPVVSTPRTVVAKPTAPVKKSGGRKINISKKFLEMEEETVPSGSGGGEEDFM